MSLDVLRDGAIESRKREIESASRAQSASLLALHAVTGLLKKNNALPSLLGCKYDGLDIASLEADQAHFLSLNALRNGHHFEEATLPFPTVSHDTHIPQPPIDHVNVAEPTRTGIEALGASSSSSHATSTDADTASALLDQAHVTTPTTQAPVLVHSSTIDAVPSSEVIDHPMADIAPPEPEEEAQFDTTTKDLVDRESPKRPARTVHLPPKKVQEQRLREMSTEKSQAQESTQHSRHHAHDLASSPSSTIGAHSAATPGPAQESPETSPDTESAPVEIPQELRPTPEQQRAKDEHDRQLAAQKAVAHRLGLGDLSTPDDQLRWEERAAAARENEERSATLQKAGPEPAAAVDTAMETQAEAFVQDLNGAVPSETKAAQDAAPTKAHADEDDHIHVVPRNNRLDSRRPANLVLPQVTQHENSSTHKNIHEMTSDSAATRRRSSAEALSPLNTRRRNTLVQTTELALRPPTWVSPKSKKSSELNDIFPDLSALQGAAEDPDKDYLEPLFRIQAHDAPNIKTGSLPDLIRSASKTLSTEDQFTTMHERMEYRILRRIYHLQNANKWSLRQMEKCKEPEQPLSHHDHMMAEMKWMCKDFRAERRRKRSVCAWLAARCAEYVTADEDEKLALRVQTRPPQHLDSEDDVPELDDSGVSPTNDLMPGTPTHHEPAITRILVEPALLESVSALQRSGALSKALKQIPVWTPEVDATIAQPKMASVSKFVDGKVLARAQQPNRKRSRFDYEDEAEQDRHEKRVLIEMPPEDPDVAIFNPDNKAMRDRLHAQNAFRPPSEFQMPTVQFYEFRNGSQWVSEDDQRLRKLARDYAFNWSIISDQLTLSSRFKSGLDRRTPWECFERWVELEQMPAEMRKTPYFKHWYQRLEQSSQNNEKRYQAQLTQAQAQAASSNTTPQHQPMRRRSLPTRVEKRKNTRYLWTVDGMRKNAKKRELAAYKQAEATRAAAQRKASQQTETQQPRQQMLTPQQFSQKRHERDVQVREAQAARQKQLLDQHRQSQLRVANAAQGLPNGTGQQQQQQQRPTAVGVPQQQQGQMNAQQANMAQMTPLQRQQLLARNGAQVNGSAVPQAQMQATANTVQQQNMARMAAQMQAQARNGQFPNQQQFAALQAGNTASPGSGNMTQQQQLAGNQALLAAYQAAQSGNHNNSAQSLAHQVSASPSMGPPPAPANNAQAMGSGVVPMVVMIKNRLRAEYPQMTEDQLQQFATKTLADRARQTAANAAAGLNIPNTNGTNVNMQAYNQNQSNFQAGNNMNNNTSSTPSFNAPSNNTANSNMNGTSGSPQQSYAQMMRSRQYAQLQQQHTPSTMTAMPNGSPSMNHASPNMAPVSPAMQFNGVNGQRPPSRSATPQMQRLGSSGSVPGVTVPGMQSPGANNLQASPRGVQASMAR